MKKESKDEMKNDEGLDFEGKTRRLEEIVAQLNEGKLPLPKALALYDEGMVLVDVLRKELEGTKASVEKLNRFTGKLEPFSHDADRS